VYQLSTVDDGGLAKNSVVWLNSQARPARHLNMAAFDHYGISAVVVARYVLLRNPSALKPDRLYSRSDMDACRGYDIAAPGIVTGMRERARSTNVANGCHFA
jgi:hypothetical protein